MSVAQTKPITAEEFMQMDFDVPVELVRGELYFPYGEDGMTSPGADHGGVCLNIGTLLHNWAKAGSHGRAASNDSWVQTKEEPDSARGVDIGYYQMARLENGKLPKQGSKIVPDLCVEVLSPTNRWSEMKVKVVEYLDAGVEEVWIVNPQQRSVQVFRTADVSSNFGEDDSLTSEVLPGFSCQVSEFFEGI